MATHRSHDRPYIEPERHDELSTGVAVSQARTSDPRRPNGTLAKGAQAVPTLGGKASKGSTRLSHRIDSPALPDPYRRRARAMRRATCSELARTVGGGACGIIPSLFVKHASVATALAEQALDEGDKDRAVKFAEASRMHLLYAREICAKDAKERPSAPTDTPWLLKEPK